MHWCFVAFANACVFCVFPSRLLSIQEMMLSIAQDIQVWLKDYNRPQLSFYEQMMASQESRLKQEAEERERQQRAAQEENQRRSAYEVRKPCVKIGFLSQLL